MENMAIVIYISQLTNRAKYVLDFVFTEYFGINYTVIPPEDFNGIFGISYGCKVDNCISIPSSGLMFEEGIRPIDYKTGLWDEIETLLPEEGFSIPFDLFSAIFLCITRYEEYKNENKDVYCYKLLFAQKR